MEKLEKLYRGFVYALPVVLFFSYFPVISLGSSETMNYELSLPMVWLVGFDIVGLLVIIWRKRFVQSFKGYWWILLFPAWMMISSIWSLNPIRGVLVSLIFGLIMFAVFLTWGLRDEFKEGFSARFFKWYIIATLLVCLWCVVQCVLDIVGVSREQSLLCPGCTYTIFGFTHPNGFAAEPQFMGNLLLAPAIITAWMYLKKLRNINLKRFLCSKFILLSFFIIVMTLFLTMSRGAIYSFIMGMLFMTGVVIWRRAKEKTSFSLKRLGVVWGVFVVSFLFALNLQGVMAEVSKTDDTYVSGVSKVVNQLTLGVIDLDGDENSSERESIVVEKSEKTEKANFSGYVEESTEVRLESSRVALKVWAEGFRKMIIGTGLGSASVVMYENGVFSTPKEIINNQYVSLLLELGLIGVVLLIITGVLIAKKMAIRCRGRIMIATVVVAYAVSLFFFSGLPNALHIYLITGVIIAIMGAYSKDLRKKLVS